MMQPLLCGGVLAALLLGSGTAAPAPPEPTMNRLAKLAGDWLLLDPEGEPTDLRARYEVTAGGAAVLETLFGETPEETVTLYRREGDGLGLTQVSGRGGPYRLASSGGKDGDAVRFAAVGEVARGLVALELTLLDDEHFGIAWTFAAAPNQTFELQRLVSEEEIAAKVARLRVDLDTLQRALDRRMKREVLVHEKGKHVRTLLETRTFPLDPGWTVEGVPLRLHLHADMMRFASTFASRADQGMTVAHWGFSPGPEAQMRFSALGGHARILLVEETRSPPRRIRSIPDFGIALDAGEYGTVLERLVGEQWKNHPAAIQWDLSRHEGKNLRLYVVDDQTNHWGQIGISEISIVETAKD